MFYSFFGHSPHEKTEKSLKQILTATHILINVTPKKEKIMWIPQILFHMTNYCSPFNFTSLSSQTDTDRDKNDDGPSSVYHVLLMCVCLFVCPEYGSVSWSNLLVPQYCRNSFCYLDVNSGWDCPAFHQESGKKAFNPWPTHHRLCWAEHIQLP